jgi:hypothetical protein
MSDERLRDIVHRLRGFLTADYALIARHRADEKQDRDITGDVEDLLSRLGSQAVGEQQSCSHCGYDPSKWVTIGTITFDPETETETFKRATPPVPVAEPGEPA